MAELVAKVQHDVRSEVPPTTTSAEAQLNHLLKLYDDNHDKPLTGFDDVFSDPTAIEHCKLICERRQEYDSRRCVVLCSLSLSVCSARLAVKLVTGGRFLPPHFFGRKEAAETAAREAEEKNYAGDLVRASAMRMLQVGDRGSPHHRDEVRHEEEGTGGDDRDGPGSQEDDVLFDHGSESPAQAARYASPVAFLQLEHL